MKNKKDSSSCMKCWLQWLYDKSALTMGYMQWVIYFKSWLIGLLHVDSSGWREDGEDSGRLYTFWGGYRKMNYMSVVHEDPLSLDDSAPYDQFGRHCNRNLQWIKSPFQQRGLDQS